MKHMKNEKMKDPKKRKLLLLLPLLVIPFLTMAFWTLGGGKGDDNKSPGKEGGLNLQLPNAQLKDDKGENKLSYYELAEKEALKKEEDNGGETSLNLMMQDTVRNKLGYDPYPSKEEAKDPYEQKVYQKLSELNQQIQAPAPTQPKRYGDVRYTSKPKPLVPKDDVDRLERLMSAGNTAREKDPEVEQLNGMMETILDIQHPERVKERLKQQSLKNQRSIYAVETSGPGATTSLLNKYRTEPKAATQFYSLESTDDVQTTNAIEAVVHESKELVDGAILKLRITTDMFINGTLIPKNCFVYGVASLRGERLEVQVDALRYGNRIFPVSLEVVDLDGGKGIYVPGTITRDVAKASASDATGTVDIGTLDPSLKAQATAAGVSTVKTLLQRKVKQVKVKLREGYRVLLKNKDDLSN